MADTNTQNQDMIVSLETLSHFKTKQDLQNLEKFKLKDDSTDLKGAVRYDTAQVLTEQEKAQAKANLGITDNGGSGGSTVEGAVRHDVEQALDEDDKARARENIGTTDGTWESMPDKPFYKSGVSYEWNGDTEGKETLAGPGNAFILYRVSPDKILKDELTGCEYAHFFDGKESVVTIEEAAIFEGSNGSLVVLLDGQFPVIMVTAAAGTENIMGMDFDIPAEGIWFIYHTETEFTKYLRKDFTIKKIDREFLPDDITVELPEGIVTTDENGLIPASVLPSYVDDVVEGKLVNSGETLTGIFNTVDDEYITPESGKIYVDVNTGNIYRWSGSQYVRINPEEYKFATNADIDALFT